MRKVSMKRRSKSDKKDANVKSPQKNGVEDHQKDEKQSDSEDKPEDYENNLELEKRKKKKTQKDLVEPSEKNKRKKSEEELDEDADDEIDDAAAKKKRKSDKRKSVSFSKKDESDSETEEEDGQFEVEAVLDDKKMKGILHYLIRWKGYGPESDTWEPESTLHCDDLIAQYRNTSKPNDKKTKPLKKEVKTKRNDDSKNSWADNDQFEVERILEVHFKRNGDREFLVSWKGYPASDNSWEPEENLQCPDLIEKFMLKVEQAKNIDQKELREFRKPTERLTLNMQETSRRLSRRLRGKQRVHYHDAE